MKQLMLVSLGGALGTVARWKLSGAVLHQSVDWRFPLSTFVVNIVGCAIAGVLAGLVTKLDYFTPDARLFLFTGLIGGFTTFSALGVETVYLLRRAEYGFAFAYVVLSVAVGIAVLWVAMAMSPSRVH